MKTVGDRKDFDPIFLKLDKKSALFKEVQGVIDNLKKGVTPGERIKYKQIPKYYIKRHNVDNAFHVYLPEGMRLIYAITIFRGEKTAFLMELADHGKYENRFKY